MVVLQLLKILHVGEGNSDIIFNTDEYVYDSATDTHKYGGDSAYNGSSFDPYYAVDIKSKSGSAAATFKSLDSNGYFEFLSNNNRGIRFTVVSNDTHQLQVRSSEGWHDLITMAWASNKRRINFAATGSGDGTLFNPDGENVSLTQYKNGGGIALKYDANADIFTVNSDTTIGGNATITGDLIIEGSTTTVNTTQMTVEDNIITLSNGISGDPDLTMQNGYSGIEVERGDEVNSHLLWNETANSWEIGISGNTETIWTTSGGEYVKKSGDTMNGDLGITESISISGNVTFTSLPEITSGTNEILTIANDGKVHESTISITPAVTGGDSINMASYLSPATSTNINDFWFEEIAGQVYFNYKSSTGIVKSVEMA